MRGAGWLAGCLTAALTVAVASSAAGSQGAAEKDSAAAESQWCIFLDKQINSKRTDHWMIVIKFSGKVTARFPADPADACTS